MDVREAIMTRRTVHRFSTEPIPEGCVERALEAAVTAPNHKLSNPWRFTRMGEETRQKITDLYVRMKRESHGELAEEQENLYRRKLGDPPEIVAVSQVLDDDDFRRKEDYAAVACAMENAMLSLWEEGVSSKWSTGSVTRATETYEMLGIDPNEEEIVGFLLIGYPREDRLDKEKPPRESLSEVVRQVP